MHMAKEARRGAWIALVVLAVVAPPATGAGADDRFSVTVSLQRNDLLSERIALGRELKDVEAEIRDAEQPVHVSGTIGKAQAVHGIRAGHLGRLRSERERLLGRIAGVDRRFESLTDRVVAHYGKEPAWWSDIR